MELPLASWTSSRAEAVNQNGSVIVGSGVPGPWIWDAADGAHLLSAELTALGVDLSQWSSMTPTGVSGDGSVIVGTGYLMNVWTSWIARLI